MEIQDYIKNNALSLNLIGLFRYRTLTDSNLYTPDYRAVTFPRLYFRLSSVYNVYHAHATKFAAKFVKGKSLIHLWATE